MVVAMFMSQGFKKLCGKYRYLTLINYACCKNALYNLGKSLLRFKSMHGNFHKHLLCVHFKANGTQLIYSLALQETVFKRQLFRSSRINLEEEGTSAGARYTK